MWLQFFFLCIVSFFSITNSSLILAENVNVNNNANNNANSNTIQKETAVSSPKLEVEAVNFGGLFILECTVNHELV
jgi:hypothetical protein